MKAFHASVEGAQHGPKGLKGFCEFAKRSGAAGVQPSNYMLDNGAGGFFTAEHIRSTVAEHGLTLDGVSAHCPFWVHTTAWTESKTIKPFLPADVASQSVEVIEAWEETYLLKLLDLCAELGIKVVPMFWGAAYGWEIATGYPWGFWKGPGYDLIQEGNARFRTKTQRLRDKARTLGIILAHEIHPGTAAQTAKDFHNLVHICGGDHCLCVNADPSHCWEGEDWQTRFTLVGDRVYGCHMKNHAVLPHVPLRAMEDAWTNRPMQFTRLGYGDLDLIRYSELMIRIGYVKRYCELHRTKTAPLVVEAEAAHELLDDVSADGVQFVRDHCCYELAAGSFEAGMGAER